MCLPYYGYTKHIKIKLVGGFNPSEKYESVGVIKLPIIIWKIEEKKCSEPPPTSIVPTINLMGGWSLLYQHYQVLTHPHHVSVHFHLGRTSKGFPGCRGTTWSCHSRNGGPWAKTPHLSMIFGQWSFLTSKKNLLNYNIVTSNHSSLVIIILNYVKYTIIIITSELEVIHSNTITTHVILFRPHQVPQKKGNHRMLRGFFAPDSKGSQELPPLGAACTMEYPWWLGSPQDLPWENGGFMVV